MPSDEQDRPRLFLTAYTLRSSNLYPIVPADASRAWMDSAEARNPKHCLPMLIANQQGWWLLNTMAFSARWDGGPSPEALEIEYVPEAGGPFPASSHFGNGIVSFEVPFIFRTSPGYNLLVRGPANLPIHGASPIEGVVETDWANVTFTMNWQLTRAGEEVCFPAGMPICCLVPFARGELSTFIANERSSVTLPEREEYLLWRKKRHEFRQEQRASSAPKWQHDYMSGRQMDGGLFSGHETRLHLSPFRREE